MTNAGGGMIAAPNPSPGNGFAGIPRNTRAQSRTARPAQRQSNIPLQRRLLDLVLGEFLGDARVDGLGGRHVGFGGGDVALLALRQATPVK